MKTQRAIVLAAGLAALWPGAGRVAAHPEVYADSLWEFSGVQGRWSYGYYDGSEGEPWTSADFDLLPLYDTSERPVWCRTLGPGGYWTAINAYAMHPNGTASCGDRISQENWAVRRWTSDQHLPARLVGYVSDVQGAVGANGVTCKIILPGGEIFSRDLEDGDLDGFFFDVPVDLEVGMTVDFVVTPRGECDYFDGTYFLVKVQGIIELEPEDQYACGRRPVTLTVGTGGPGIYSYIWCKDGIPMLGETGPACTIESPRAEDAGMYDCLVSDEMGVVASRAARVLVCEADMNCDGFVDFGDYLEYLNRYDGQEPAADLNEDGFIDFADFLEFLNLYDAGCPTLPPA
ncbi:MAG: hypothetical protein IT436_00530 [Phycisphaerales bacterium]|nr:hypothetical protein [Phycisphaerales bacterium]